MSEREKPGLTVIQLYVEEDIAQSSSFTLAKVDALVKYFTSIMKMEERYDQEIELDCIILTVEGGLDVLLQTIALRIQIALEAPTQGQDFKVLTSGMSVGVKYFRSMLTGEE